MSHHKNDRVAMLDYAIQAVLFVTCFYPLVQQDWFLATQTLSTLVISLIAAALARGVDPVFAPVFLSAVLFNAAGWVFGLYESLPPYDEISHFITPTVFTMVLGAIITKIFYNRIAKRVPFFFYILLALGVALGAVWEIAEYVFFTYIQPQYEMTMEDTISDLALDVLGAALGSYIISRWNKDQLVRAGDDLREIPYIALFDSATSMVRHLTHVLHKRDSKGLQMLPVMMTPLLSMSTIIPRKIRSWFFQHSGCLDALHPDYTSEVNIHQIGNAICENYPQKKYPVVLFGSANGALTHLCAAMGIPYLPQTLPLLLRKGRMNPEEPIQDLEWGKPYAEELLALNPDLHIAQMIDPVHDRIMSQVICYFRIKIIGLIESYKRFMIDNLEPGGTILISNCTKQWWVHTINPRYTFQVGGAGDLTAEEYNNGGKRLAQFLKHQGVRKKKLTVPDPDAYQPEAEWGYDTRITEDITAFAQKHGFKVEMLTYAEPEDPSAFIADLYRSWYTDLGYEADRLFVESFMYLEPYWTLHARLIPYWMYWNTYESYNPLTTWLKRQERPFKDIYLTLFSNGIKAPDFISMDKWKEVFTFATDKSGFLGTNPERFPEDFDSSTRYYLDLKDIVDREYQTPPYLKYDNVKSFFTRHRGSYNLKWKSISS